MWFNTDVNTLYLLVTFLCLAAASSARGQSAPGKLSADDLRVEYLVNPLAIDKTLPRFGWTLQGDGTKQIAYEIEVTAAAQDSAAALWQSGKVESAATNQIVYAGKPLGSRTAATWRVKIYDQDGNASAWSAPATFRMGLLKPEDWSAKWLDATTPDSEAKIVVTQAVYRAIDGSAEKDVTKLVEDSWQDPRFTVTNEALGGDPKFGVVKRLHVAYTQDGTSHEAAFEEKARIDLPPRPLAAVRREFNLAKSVQSATLYVSSLGLHKTHINGQPVMDATLAPDWTEYDARVIYDAIDVTKLVTSGDNAIAARIGPGWFCGTNGNGTRQVWGKTPAYLAQLEITFTDGSTQKIVTDDSWQVGPTAILSSDAMLGETYDARLEQTGWDKPKFAAPGWAAAKVVEGGKRNLVVNTAERVRPVGEIKPIAVRKAGAGHFVFDLGQNFVGVVRLNFHGGAGKTVTIRHAEILDDQNELYTTNLRGAPSIDHITFGQDAKTSWQPTFTFHGFRYVELSGVEGDLTADSITGIIYASDVKQAGTFECSDPRLNQLQSNIYWGMRGNFVSVPTDCPQRDERLGWMGDAQVFVGTAAYNGDVAAFFTRWLWSVRDAQREDGRFTDVVPDAMRNAPDFRGRTQGWDSVPGWGDAGAIVPWSIYRTYGDRKLLADSYDSIRRWVEWQRAHSTDLIRDRDRGNDYGDWLSINADTNKELLGTAYFAHSTDLLARSARVLGNEEDAKKYEALFNDIKAAFNRKYVKADGEIEGNTQTTYALAIAFGLIDGDAKRQAAERLVADIEAKGNHLSTGFLGVSHLLPVLSSVGRDDVALKLLVQDTFPSWLFSVKHGATTIWERWDGWTPDKGFQDPGMNSFNHYSLGSCGEWMFRNLAGIGQADDSVGFKKLVIAPRVGAGLTWVKATYDSPAGRIESGWKVADDKLTLDVVIPPNTNATIRIPSRDSKAQTKQVGPGKHTFTAAWTK